MDNWIVYIQIVWQEENMCKSEKNLCFQGICTMFSTQFSSRAKYLGR